MDVVVQKTEEEHLLANCDGTCSSGDECLCIVDIGATLAGQAMYDYGFSKCLLCNRRDGQQYCTIPENYPVEWIQNGFKIKYNKENYKLVSVNNIEHVISVINDEICEESWISSLYYTTTTVVDKISVDWKLPTCDTHRCKHPVHAYIDVHRAVGVSNSYYDIIEEMVKCEFCHKSLHYIDSNNGVVEYNDQSYAQCRFCSTIIFFSQKLPVQICSTCTDQCKSDIQKGRHICLYCKNTVNITQRKNIQEFKIRKTPTSCTETIYLCRLHRVYPPDPTKIFKISELLSLF
jgi:hypothetical protein